MKYSQYRAFGLTAKFFHIFRNVKYKHVPVVRAMAYSFHLKAVVYYRHSKPTGRNWVRGQRQLYAKLVASDRVTPVPYRPSRRLRAKIVYSILAPKGLNVNLRKNIVCIESHSNRRLKAPYYNPWSAGRLHRYKYTMLLRQIRSITRRKGVHPYFKRKAFMKWFKVQLRSVMRKIDGIDRLFAANRIRGVVQFSSVNPMGYLLVHMGKQRRIPTINLQYGLNDTYQILSTNVDHYVAWGEHHRQRLTRLGAPGHKFHLLGNARFEPIFNGKWMNKNQLSKQLGIRGNKTIFVYPEQPLQPHINRIVMNRIIRALLPYRNRVVLLVKKHPRQTGSGLTPSLRRRYPFVKLIRHRAIHLYDLISGADVVFVQFSTVGLEAMLLRKPVISLALFRDTNKHEYSYYASSKLVTSARGFKPLSAIVHRFMTSRAYRQIMMANQQRYCRESYNGGANAGSHIKELIQSVTGVKLGRVTAVIPVRANAYCTEPLIQQTIQAARDSQWIDRILVATDRPELFELSAPNGTEIRMYRPYDPVLYRERDACSELLLNLLQQEADRESEADTIILLQPSFPLRTGAHIANAMQLFIRRNADAVVSVSQTGTKQQRSTETAANGAIVVAKTSVLREAGTLQETKTLPFVMPAADAFEVLTEQDEEHAAQLKLKQKLKKKRLKRKQVRGRGRIRKRSLKRKRGSRRVAARNNRRKIRRSRR